MRFSLIVLLSVGVFALSLRSQEQQEQPPSSGGSTLTLHAALTVEKLVLDYCGDKSQIKFVSELFQYNKCREMAISKAVDANFAALVDENERLRTALYSFCGLPNIGQSAKDACFALWRDLAAKKK